MNKGSVPIAQLISLKGRTALVTGSAVGIGRAIAQRYAEAGCELDLVDIDKDGLLKLKGELSQTGTEVEVHEVDISKKEEIDALWKELKGSPPDILVNNAGIYPFKDFLEVDEALLKRTMDINFSSVFWMCQKMIESRINKGGVIINVGSIEAILPFKDALAHYGPSKAGVIALSRALARDYGKKGFRVNVLLPGGIVTPGTKRAAEGILRMEFGLVKSGVEFRARLPLGRFGDPDEVARMALVLASDLSSYVSGALIAVDGGFLSA